MRRRFSPRRGVTMVQYCVMIALVLLGVVGGVALLGERTNDKINETAKDLDDPGEFVKQFSKD